MAGGYVIGAITIMVLNADKVPHMFALIFNSAFGAEAAYGAVIGLASSGASSAALTPTKRGRAPAAFGGGCRSVASREAGLRGRHSRSTSTRSSSARRRRHHSSTTCTTSSARWRMILERLPALSPVWGTRRPALSQRSPDSAPRSSRSRSCSSPSPRSLPTIHAETNIAFINRKIHRPWIMQGAARRDVAAWSTQPAYRGERVDARRHRRGADVLAQHHRDPILQKPAIQALKDYEAQKKAGRDPTSIPRRSASATATLWSERKARRYSTPRAAAVVPPVRRWRCWITAGAQLASSAHTHRTRSRFTAAPAIERCASE